MISFFYHQLRKSEWGTTRHRPFHKSLERTGRGFVCGWTKGSYKRNGYFFHLSSGEERITLLGQESLSLILLCTKYL